MAEAGVESLLKHYERSRTSIRRVLLELARDHCKGFQENRTWIVHAAALTGDLSYRWKLIQSNGSFDRIFLREFTLAQFRAAERPNSQVQKQQ